MRSFRIAFILPVFLVLQIGCQNPSAGSVDTAAVKDTLLQHARRFSEAYMQQDLEALAAAYTDSAFALPGNGAIVRGADSIAALFRDPDDIEVVHHEIQPIEVHIDGDHAYDVGHYEYRIRQDGELRPVRYGKYTIVWRRVAGRWRIHVDQWASRPRPQEGSTMR